MRLSRQYSFHNISQTTCIYGWREVDASISLNIPDQPLESYRIVQQRGSIYLQQDEFVPGQRKDTNLQIYEPATGDTIGPDKVLAR
jgi:hypothetical protein